MIRATLFATAALLSTTPQANGEEIASVAVTAPGDSSVSQPVVLPLDKSTVVDLPKAAGEVIITNPAIADATVQTDKRLIFRGVAVGQTNAIIFDQKGDPIVNLEITVERDLATLEALIRRHAPDSRVRLEAVNDNIVVTGFVTDQAEQDRIFRLALSFIGNENADALVDMTSVAAEDQVLLRVRIIELQRTVAKELGLRLDGQFDFGVLPDDVFQSTIQTGLSNAGSGIAAGGLSGQFNYFDFIPGAEQSNLQAGIEASENVGILRTLAEPNLTAISGETADFLAGGEFPFPNGVDQNNNVIVEFKPFGIGLAFTPLVLSEGRISLKVATEVSELTDTTFSDIPGLNVRRASTTVELPSGGSMMIAGLLQSSTRQSIAGVPGAKDLPVLGALFRSRDFENDETELVIIVTPLLVNPTSPDRLRSPADGYQSSSDVKGFLFGKLNDVYGRPGGEAAADEYQAPVGFIEE